MYPHWTQSDLVVNGVRLHYYRTGYGDKRPLILAHGFSDNGLCWTPVAHDLESEFDVIMPDIPDAGHLIRFDRYTTFIGAPETGSVKLS